MKRILALVFGLVLLAVPAVAADVDGKWTGSIETPMGAVPVGFTFKADGAALSGDAFSGGAANSGRRASDRHDASVEPAHFEMIMHV